jgi:L-asparaginase / beta-aspartyl-peptidase
MRNKIFISIFMYVFSILGLIAQIQVTTLPSLGTNEEAKKKWGLAIHGGAGTIIKENMTPELEAAYTQKLNECWICPTRKRRLSY